MNILFTYIKAIHLQESSVAIINKVTKTNCYTDDEIEVNEKETIYHFDNGVVICYKTETDNAPCELLCEECWISYEVLDSCQQKITPLRKIFHNSCQESFWLKMQLTL
ncbi:hypothetical protein [Psychromonas ossibalaenae]|uniref:hypothetical protein n=1 Tax=Psychromonas ossibalaenae TaxID=444922 RepID=UPI00035D3EF9|nr:hypothetical protein [Psychromonas ossibalaenae]